MTQWLDIDDENRLIKQTDTIVPYEGREFGEGISVLDDDSWVELTWKDGIVNILDRDSLELLDTMDMWPGVTQGWGITLDPENRILYATDGSANVTMIDADTLEQTGQF